MQQERRLFRLRGIAIVALAAKFTQKRTVTKEQTTDAIRVPVAHRPVVGLGVLAVRWHHAVTKVRVALRLNMLAVARKVSRVGIEFTVTAKAGLVQTQRLAVANALVIRIVEEEKVA